MWLVVGLGNPGPRYARTRHNAGFMAAKEIAGRHRIELRTRESYVIGKGSIEGNEIILVEPLTFMNRSGPAVKGVAKRYAVPADRLIVIHDDIDMETGRLKIRKRGSSGGHKGVESIIEAMGSKEFIRVKIGVGREGSVPVETYVLSRFRSEELPLLEEAVRRAADAVETILNDGVERAMNRFN